MDNFRTVLVMKVAQVRSIEPGLPVISDLGQRGRGGRGGKSSRKSECPARRPLGAGGSTQVLLATLRRRPDDEHRYLNAIWKNPSL